MNMDIPIPVQFLLSFLVCMYPEVELLDHMVILCLIFLRNRYYVVHYFSHFFK